MINIRKRYASGSHGSKMKTWTKRILSAWAFCGRNHNPSFRGHDLRETRNYGFCLRHLQLSRAVQRRGKKGAAPSTCTPQLAYIALPGCKRSAIHFAESVADLRGESEVQVSHPTFRTLIRLFELLSTLIPNHRVIAASLS